MIPLAIFSFLACQHRTAEVCQQAEVLMQARGMEQGGVLHRFHITVYLVRGHGHLMVQFTGLLIFSSGRKQEYVVSR